MVIDALARICAACGRLPGESCLSGMGRPVPPHLVRRTGDTMSPEARERSRIYGREKYRASVLNKEEV
jgi:hypothetical protein